MSGVRKERMFYGRWVSAEGAIWENFDPHRHIITGEVTQRTEDGRWQLNVPEWGPATIELKWFAAGMDFGFRNPGCMLVAGMDKDRRIFIIEQHYKAQTLPDKWADWCEAARKKYDVLRFVCDCAEPDRIEQMNQRMGKAGGYWTAEGCKKHKNAKEFEVQASAVRERFASDSLYFLRGGLHETDQELIEFKKPTCIEQEIPSYCWKEVKHGMAVKEEPRPDSIDHGCDALRYLVYWLETRDWQPTDDKKRYPVGSYGQIMGHDGVWGD